MAYSIRQVFTKRARRAGGGGEVVVVVVVVAGFTRVGHTAGMTRRRRRTLTVGARRVKARVLSRLI